MNTRWQEPSPAYGLGSLLSRGTKEMVAGENLQQNLSSLMQSASLGVPKLRVFPFWTSPENPAEHVCSSSQLREANQHCNLLFLTAEFSEQKAEFSSAHSHSGQIQPTLPPSPSIASSLSPTPEKQSVGAGLGFPALETNYSWLLWN